MLAGHKRKQNALFRSALVSVLFLLGFGCSLPLFAQVQGLLSSPLQTAVDSAVRAEMNTQKLVGVSVGIIRNGKIVYTQAYGLADRENRKPVTSSTVFNWASNSKPLAAVLAMQLVESKQLDLDEDVRTYVPEFPDKGKVITMRQLLCHQSGIPHYRNGKIVATKSRLKKTLAEMDPIISLNHFNLSPLIFSPGEKKSYSSYAYILASAVIQRAGKDSFSNQVQKRIAQPLSMSTLQFDTDSKGKQNWTIGYTKNKLGQIVPTTESAHFWKHGAGAFKSTIGDFARWAEALINHELVSTDIEKQMWAIQNTSDGQPTDMGLGFFISDQNGLKVSHNGRQGETTTRMVLYPKSQHGVVVMCNCDFGNPGKISTAIYSALKRK